jgi:hypothetical protein
VQRLLAVELRRELLTRKGPPVWLSSVAALGITEQVVVLVSGAAVAVDTAQTVRVCLLLTIANNDTVP